MLLKVSKLLAFQSAEVWELVTNKVTLRQRIIKELSDKASNDVIKAVDNNLIGEDSN